MDKEMNILFVHPLEGNEYEIYKALEKKKKYKYNSFIKREIKIRK